MARELVIYNIIQICLITIFYYSSIKESKFIKVFLSVLFSFIYILFFMNFKEYMINASYLFIIPYIVITIVLVFVNKRSISINVRLSILPHIFITSSFLISLYVISLYEYWLIDIEKVLENNISSVLILSLIVEVIWMLIIKRNNQSVIKNNSLFSVILIDIDMLLMVVENYILTTKFSTIEWIIVLVSVVLLLFTILYESRNDHELQKTTEELYTIKHDLKHALTMIKVNELEEELNHVFIPIHTGNQVIDTILNQKLEILKDKGIEYKCYVNITENINISEEDFSTILINLLDNCIEHCGGKDKFVSIYIYNKNKNLILKVSNTIEDNILDQDGNIKRKEYLKGHGYGMYSIKKTVDKYDGIINLTEENHNFCCGIVFFGE